MTGMKEGAGEDPFAEEDDTTPTESNNRSVREEPPTSTEPSTQPTDREQPRQQESMQIPYKFRRDGVQDGRDRVPLFLQSDTKSAERDALRELEDRFDSDVSLTDLREALVKVGLQNLDKVETHLEEWGYGLTFEE